MNNNQIIEEIKDQGGNLSAVARAMGIDYVALRQRFPTTHVPLVVPTGPEPSDIKTLGKAGMTQYVVAVKKVGQGWPEKYESAIADARKKFDAGTHEMFQLNNNGWVVQYLIPYLVPVPRRQFFSTMIVMR